MENMVTIKLSEYDDLKQKAKDLNRVLNLNEPICIQLFNGWHVETIYVCKTEEQVSTVFKNHVESFNNLNKENFNEIALLKREMFELKNKWWYKLFKKL